MGGDSAEKYFGLISITIQNVNYIKNSFKVMRSLTQGHLYPRFKTWNPPRHAPIFQILNRLTLYISVYM